MSTGLRLPLADAARVAQEIYGQLAPSCVRLGVAGSVRREKADVGDIEFVAIPRYREEPASLWGDTAQVSVLSETLAMLEGERPERTHSAMLERLSGGDRYVKLRHLASGMQVDLFLTTAEQWGLILLIRTGPADYSQWLVTYARHRGFHVIGGRLHRGLGTPGREDCTCPVIPTPSEESVYTALGLPWIEPSERRVP
jgi:DNA polymerase/3'-5' exonuclease PolX